MAFQGPGGVQTHTEIGLPLIDVLAVAGVAPTFNSWVAAVGSDNDVAVVTPGEQLVGGRSLQLSLKEDGVVLDQPDGIRARWPAVIGRRYAMIGKR